MLTNLSPNEILSYYGITWYSGNQPPGYVYSTKTSSWTWTRKLGLILVVLTLGGLVAVIYPYVGLESNYLVRVLSEQIRAQVQPKPIENEIPVVAPAFNPLIDPQGQEITPVNNDFSLVIPSIGVNAPVVAGVNPTDTSGYTEALKKGVAHASTSYYPNENGTVYLFSHSTNYEWFVKDLNAVFYLIKNLEAGDYVVVMYLGDRFTYQIREKQVVSAKSVSFLKPQAGTNTLILQTCWPPGSSYQRLLIFADLVEAKHFGKFDELKGI